MANKIDPAQMSEEEIELRLELLARKRVAGGSGAPPLPPTATAAAPAEPTPGAGTPKVIRLQGRTKTPIEPRWFSVTKVCPRCKKEKNVGKDFGVIVQRDVQYANGWCAQCRSEASADYKTKARKNHSVNNPEKPLARPRVKNPRGPNKRTAAKK